MYHLWGKRYHFEVTKILMFGLLGETATSNLIGEKPQEKPPYGTLGQVLIKTS
jgi:hypothetical protein